MWVERIGGIKPFLCKVSIKAAKKQKERLNEEEH
jgi:hypothetical protein